LGVSVRNAKDGTLIAYQFLGHEVYSSIAYANDLQTPKLYAGCDTYSVTCLNATAMVRNETPYFVLSNFQTKAEVQSSPTVAENKLFVSSTDGTLYMFTNVPTVTMSIYANANKVNEMWSNETLFIEGRLQPAITSTDFGSFGNNGLPYANVTVSLTRPDSTSLNLTTTTDALGNFNVSHSPTDIGAWGWVAYYLGETKPSIVYSSAYTVWNPINVMAAPITTATPTPSPTASPTATPTATVTPTPTPTATPISGGGFSAIYIYAIAAIVIIILVAIIAYAYAKRRKKPQQ
jgi:hypothetical protein